MCLRYLSEKGSETHANTSWRLTRSVCSRSIHAIRVREVCEIRTTMVAVRMRIGIYTVRELRDDTVAMGLRFCFHEVVVKNRNQFATFFFDKYTYIYPVHVCICAAGLSIWTCPYMCECNKKYLFCILPAISHHQLGLSTACLPLRHMSPKMLLIRRSAVHLRSISLLTPRHESVAM